MKPILALAGCVLLFAVFATFSAADEKPAPPAPAAAAAPAAPAATPFDAVKSLAGTWESDKPQGGAPATIEFKVIANGSAVVETMLPGTAHEMVNMYHMDGEKLMM